jgi:hypothetical protein
MEAHVRSSPEQFEDDIVLRLEGDFSEPESNANPRFTGVLAFPKEMPIEEVEGVKHALKSCFSIEEQYDADGGDVVLTCKRCSSSFLLYCMELIGDLPSAQRVTCLMTSANMPIDCRRFKRLRLQ